MAKLESFFCHDPRSRLPLSDGFAATGSGEDDGNGAESGATGAGSSFSGLSGAFFFEPAIEVVVPQARLPQEQRAQCRSA